MIILGLVLLVAAVVIGVAGRFKQPQRETAAAEQERDVLINERGSARAQTAQAEGADEDPAGLVERPRHKGHWFRHRAAH